MNRSLAVTSVAIGIIVVIFLGLILMNIYNNSSNTTGVGTGSVIDTSIGNDSGDSDSSNTNSDGTKIFYVSGSHLRFYVSGSGFENPEIKVKQGDKVRIEFTSKEGFHDFVIDEFNAATARVGVNGYTYVEFVADKTGEFEYYCSVGEHRANGMFGKFIVE